MSTPASTPALPPAATRVIEAIRPHPHRGPVIAAGAVPLAVAIVLIELRFGGEWSAGALLLVTGLAAALVLGMGLLAPLEGEAPRPYHTVLLVAGLLLALSALTHLADLLGAEAQDIGSGTVTWIALLFTAAAAWPALRLGSAICWLLAAAGAGVTVLAFVDWAFSPDEIATFRYVLVFLAGCYVTGSLVLRDERPRHALQLVNAAGLASLAIALTFGIDAIGSLFSFFGDGSFSIAWGWELYLVAAGFSLVAYAAADREPGPAYIGVLVLLAFGVIVGQPSPDGPSLIGWPLFLLAVGLGGVVLGLRPRAELPPEPAAATAPATATPLAPAPDPDATQPPAPDAS